MSTTSPSIDLNFSPQLRPFYESDFAGHADTLGALLIPAGIKPLSPEPTFQIRACKLRSGGVVVPPVPPVGGGVVVPPVSPVPAPGGVAGALGLSSSPPPQATSRAQLNAISPCSILMAISL